MVARVFPFAGLIMSSLAYAQSVPGDKVGVVGKGPALDIGGMLGALVLVLLCLFAVAWLLRRAKLGNAPSQAGVKVLAQMPLNLKEKLLVVQVGGERLLLGCAPGCIRTLHCWQAEDVPPEHTDRGFAELLNSKLDGLRAPGQRGGKPQ